jgi:hypothetical protein
VVYLKVRIRHFPAYVATLERSEPGTSSVSDQHNTAVARVIHISEVLAVLADYLRISSISLPVQVQYLKIGHYRFPPASSDNYITISDST